MTIPGVNSVKATISGLERRDVLVLLAVMLCVSNILLVSVLAITGTLRTTQQGDIETTRSTTIEEGVITLQGDHRFVIESPTDADVFYNVVVLVQNGGPLYTGVGQDPFVQLIFNYFPLVYYLFPPLVSVGYILYKFLWMFIALIATAVGTALLLHAEARQFTTRIPSRTIWSLSLVSVGFHPMVANFKVGQTTPLIYFFIALFWYLFRRGRLWTAGGALVGAALFKPYVAAPIALGFRLDRWRAVAGFVATYILANVVSLLTWGLTTTISYYQKLIRFLLDEGHPETYDSFSAWSASHLRMFYWLGPYAPYVRVALLVPAAVVVARSVVKIDEDPVPVFSLALIGIIIGLKTTTAIDLGLMLAVVILLGVRFYSNHERQWPLAMLVVAIAGLQAHEYVLELLAGWGAENLTLIASNESIIILLLPALQPGMYSVFTLYALAMFAWAESAVW
jgi:hypothetical protein